MKSKYEKTFNVTNDEGRMQFKITMNSPVVKELGCHGFYVSNEMNYSNNWVNLKENPELQRT